MTYDKKAIFDSNQGLTFDDVLVIPAYSEVLPHQVAVKSNLAANFALQTPIVAAAMDTVSEAKMAIAMAREGGLAFIHRNLSIEKQAEEVDLVKRSESGMIVNPATLGPEATIQDAENVMAKYRISGLPITDKEGHLLGILTNRDIRFISPESLGDNVTKWMTKENLVTALEDTSLDEAKRILQKHRIEKLLLVDSENRLRGLITVKDIQKKRDYPNASIDAKGRLQVGAAIGVSEDVRERIEALLAVGVDCLTIDTAHGHSAGVINTIKLAKSIAPNVPLCAGNVVTAQGAEDLIKAGADAIKVGVGAGSICTTRIIAGAGMPQLSAIWNCSHVTKKYGASLIADGGIKHSGDIVKAFAAGADVVMLGSLLSGLEESPGEVVVVGGRRFKEYRGMGSLGAMQGLGRDRYATGQGKGQKTVTEGIEGRVPYKGSLSEVMFQLVGGLRSGMGYAGCATLADLKEAKMVQITNAGLIESHPHNILITREAPNYQSHGKALE